MICLVCKTTKKELFCVSGFGINHDGFCEDCLKILSGRTPDSTGFCKILNPYENVTCSNSIHFTHTNNRWFEKNIGICEKHVKEGLKYFKELKAKQEAQKPIEKKPELKQLSLF